MLVKSNIKDGWLMPKEMKNYLRWDYQWSEYLVIPEININEYFPNYGKVTCKHTGWDLNLFTGKYDVDGYPIFINHVFLDAGFFSRSHMDGRRK